MECATATPESILKIAMGFMAAKHLFVASEIGLFEALASGPKNLDQLAQEIEVPSRTLGIIAAAMLALGLIELEGGRYRNSAAAATFLAGICPVGQGRSGFDLRPMVRYYDKVSYPLWQKLAEAVRNNESQAHLLAFDQSQRQLYSAGVEAFTARVATALSTAYDFSGHRRLLDLAGGTGSFLVSILRHYPALNGTLFDLSETCSFAQQQLAALPERRRIDIVEGDVFKVPLPLHHDVVLMANAVHMFSPARNVELMKRIRAKVQDGARLLLVDLWTDATHSEPATAALMAGAFLLTSGEGQTYSEVEVGGWLEQTGWRKCMRTELSGPTSLIVAEAI
jgi:hypothetical protein